MLKVFWAERGSESREHSRDNPGSSGLVRIVMPEDLTGLELPNVNYFMLKPIKRLAECGC
jgi:hypothetical protein